MAAIMDPVPRKNKYIKKTASGVEINESKVEEFLKKHIFHKVENNFTDDPRSKPSNNIPIPELIFRNGSFLVPEDKKGGKPLSLGGLLQEMAGTEKTFHCNLVVIKEIFRAYEDKLKLVLGENFYDKYLQGVMDVLDTSNAILKKLEECVNGGLKFSELEKKLDELSIIISENMRKNQILSDSFLVLSRPDDPAINGFLDGLLKCQNDIEGSGIDTDEGRRNFLKDKILSSGDSLANDAAKFYDIAFSGGARMQSLVITPFQRMAKYPLLMKAIYGFVLTEKDRGDSYNLVKEEIMKRISSIPDLDEKEMEAFIVAEMERLEFPGKWVLRPIFEIDSFNEKDREREKGKLWPYDLVDQESIRKMAIKEDNLKRKIKISQSDFSIGLSGVSLEFDIDEFCSRMARFSGNNKSEFFGMSFQREKIGEKDVLMINNKNGNHFMSIEISNGNKSKNIDFKLLKVIQQTRLMGELRDDLASVMGVFQDSFVEQAEKRNDKSVKDPVCRFQCDWDTGEVIVEKITEINHLFGKRLKNVRKNLKRGVIVASAPALTPAPIGIPPVAPAPADPTLVPTTGAPAAPIDKALTTPAAPTTLITSSTLADDLTAVEKGALRFKSHGSSLPQRTQRDRDEEEETIGREQRLGRASGFTISSALIHHLQKADRGQVLFADCDTEKEYNGFANRGTEQMHAARHELFERRDKTQSRLGAYRDYHDGLEIHDRDDRGVQKIVEKEGGGMMIRRYNAAEKRAEILIKPGSDRIILAALEANQYIQPLKIKIPTNQGQPIAEKDLNRGDMEFLLKTLVAGKISGIPVKVDRAYQEMIAKRFPEVIEQIERIKVIDKEDIQELIQDKENGDYELSDLVDAFASRGNKRAHEVDPDEPDPENGSNKRKRP